MQNFPTRQISEIGLANSHCHTQHLQSDTFQTLIVSAAVSTLLLHTLPLLAREARCTTIPQSGRTRSWRSGTGRQLRDKRSRYLSTLVDNCQRISYLQACHNLDHHITQSFLSPPGALIAIPTYYSSTTIQPLFQITPVHHNNLPCQSCITPLLYPLPPNATVRQVSNSF